MAKIKNRCLGLSEEQIAQFIHDGYVRIDNAFPRHLATKARARMWRDTGCDPNDRSTWTQPVIRLFVYWQKPFREAANTPILHRAFDQLVGKNRWLPREAIGTFVVRFPSSAEPGDTGWHIDSSFPGPEFEGVPDEKTDFSQWRVNITSCERALLMLFLFSDVGEDDAPTRLRVRSHQDIARILAPAGAAGIKGTEIDCRVSEGRSEVLAIGPAGTVYLCHPFLVHAGQTHRGSTPRFLAQPGLQTAVPLSIDRADADYAPVEIAIRQALSNSDETAVAKAK